MHARRFGRELGFSSREKSEIIATERAAGHGTAATSSSPGDEEGFSGSRRGAMR